MSWNVKFDLEVHRVMIRNLNFVLKNKQKFLCTSNTQLKTKEKESKETLKTDMATIMYCS